MKTKSINCCPILPYPGDHSLNKQIKQLTGNTSTQVSAFLVKLISVEILVYVSCYKLCSNSLYFIK